MKSGPMKSGPTQSGLMPNRLTWCGVTTPRGTLPWFLNGSLLVP